MFKCRTTELARFEKKKKKQFRKLSYIKGRTRELTIPKLPIFGKKL